MDLTGLSCVFIYVYANTRKRIKTCDMLDGCMAEFNPTQWGPSCPFVPQSACSFNLRITIFFVTDENVLS